MIPKSRNPKSKQKGIGDIKVTRQVEFTSRSHRSRPSKMMTGRLTAKLLEGAWRYTPPNTTTSLEELEYLAPLLLRSGAAGLAWSKLRNSDFHSTKTVETLHQAYRMQSLQSVLHERSLKRAVSLLKDQGIESIVVKGWSIARAYSDVAVRPYCDLDLCVSPEDYEKAGMALRNIEGGVTNVDLHAGFGKFYDARTDDIFDRSQVVSLEGIPVRILCPEDNLRYLCMHLLRHGAVRPLWLCDIGVVLESLAVGFDWDRCMSGSRRHVQWMSCAIKLAAMLLGVNIENTPVARQSKTLPRWLVKAVLRDWGVAFRSPWEVKAMLRRPVGFVRELPGELSRHWPNPIEATMTLRGPLNRIPRLPFQLGHVASRTFVLLSELFADSRAVHSRS